MKLTDRQIQVLYLICQQKTNKEISHQLKIAPRTVESIRERIIINTDSKCIVGAVLWAVKHGIYVP